MNDASRLREYVAFNPVTIPLPVVVGRINNQDLHNTTPKDYIIISYAPFSFQAQRVAQFHADRGLDVLVVTTDQVYNEFGSGRPGLS